LSTATFRRASLEQAPRDPFLLRAQDAILAYLERGEPLSGLPVDVSTGTPFQQSVWQALCRIAHGTTQSYSEIATVVGRPRAARAVGRACGSNPVAILIPCHRVIARDGSLGGYSGGLRIKQALLDLEAAWVLQRSS
jgi:O-6-methylguanine DNA methyltransferase